MILLLSESNHKVLTFVTIPAHNLLIKILMKKTLWLLPFPLWLSATEYQPKKVPDDTFVEQSEILANPAVQQPAPMTTAKQESLSLDKDTLLANPELLKRAMHSVLITYQIDGIRTILPIYQQLSDADANTIRYAKAVLAHSQGKLSDAIADYRSLIAADPNLSEVRFNLATALAADGQSTAARDQLTRLKTENLPEEITQTIDETLAQINRQEDWQFNANFYYRQENNINNAPKQRKMAFGRGTLIFPEPEKAKGIHLTLGAKKRFNLSDNIYSNIQFDASSDFYWNNHKYDDLSLRVGTGLGYQNSRFTAEIQPFIKKRFFGTEPYSLSTGAAGIFRYKFTPQWQVSNNWEWSYAKFDTREFLNGNRKSIGLSAVYMPSSQQYWTAGIHYHETQAREAEDNFHRTGAFIGWGQEWKGGLSSNLTLSAGKRRYGGVDFFNILREDKEYAAKLALWHRGVHFWGITPRLVSSWNKTDSNHFYYSKNNTRFNIEFSKTF